jgi:hypothetical protein
LTANCIIHHATSLAELNFESVMNAPPRFLSMVTSPAFGPG